jgi:hypothetical protein
LAESTGKPFDWNAAENMLPVQNTKTDIIISTTPASVPGCASAAISFGPNRSATPITPISAPETTRRFKPPRPSSAA